MSKVIVLMAIITFMAIFVGIIKHRKKSMRIILLISSIYLVLAGFSFFITNKTFPEAKSSIKIELSDFSEDVSSVFLSEITIDEKIFQIEKLEEGTWVLQNQTIGWRNPDITILTDMTDFVSVKIPKGYSRQLQFTVKGERVHCSIIEENHIIEADLVNGINHVKLKGSEKIDLYMNKLGEIGFFVVLLGVFIFLFEFISKKNEKFFCFLEKNKFYVALFAIAILSFICMYMSSDIESFWYDEAYTVGWLQENDPISSMFIAFETLTCWLNMMPYGQKYLLLITEFLTVFSVIFTGLSGKELRNSQTGLFSAAFVGFSSYIIHNAAFEFRSYAFLLFFTTTTFYLFLIRNKMVECNKKFYFTICCYSLSLMLLVDSQEYGKVIGGLYIFMDFILILGKKIKKRNAFAWILPIGYLGYWLMNNLVGGLWNNYSWPPNPNFQIVMNTLLTLCGGQYEIFVLFLIGFGITIKKGIDYLKHKVDEQEAIGYAALFVTLVGMFAASIIYSNIINPQNSLYVNRYFISIIFNIFMMAAFGADLLVQSITKGYEKAGKDVAMYTCTGVIILMCWILFLKSSTTHYEDFRGTAQWTKSQEDIYNKDVMVFIPESPYHCLGWLYYFCEEELNHKPALAGATTLDLNNTKYNKIYVITLKRPPSEQQQEWLDTHYVLKNQIEKYGISVYKKK